MKKAKRLIYWIFYYLLLSGLVEQFIWKSPFISVIPDIMVLYLGICTYKIRSREPIGRYIGNGIKFLIVFFLLVGSVSALLNTVPVLTWLWGIRLYVRYYILFMAMYKLFDKKDVCRLKSIFQKYLMLNILFIVAEYWLLGIKGDSVGGLFSGGNSAFWGFVIPTLLLFTGDFYQKRIRLITFLLTLLGIFYFAIVGESKIVYFMVPLMVYGMYVLLKRFSIKHIIVLAIAYIALIPTMQYFIAMYYGNDYADRIFKTEYIEEETSGTGFGGDFNRSTQIEMSQIYFMHTPVDAMLGHGIGVGSSSKIFQSEFANKYKHTVFQYFSISFLLAETGWLGFIAYVIGHVLLLLHFCRLYWKYGSDKCVKYWTSCGIMSVGITFLMFWYNNTPVFNYYFIYILWALCFISIKFRKKELLSKSKDE